MISTGAILALQPTSEVESLARLMLQFATDPAVYESRLATLPPVLIGSQPELMKAGMFNALSLSHLLMSDEEYAGGGIQSAVVQHLINGACENNLAYALPYAHFFTHAFARDMISNPLARENLVAMIINRPEFVVRRYGSCTFCIEIEKEVNGIFTQFRGTGFIGNTSGRKFFLTVKHNVDPAESVTRILSLKNDSVSIEAPSLDEWIFSENLDIAAFEITSWEGPTVTLGPLPMLLSEVITLGYPAVPSAAGAYMLAHRGEINAVVASYLQAGEHLLISNMVSPGSSGSPVINRAGYLQGVVTSQFSMKGGEGIISTMQAALSAAEILEFVNKKIVINTHGLRRSGVKN